MRRASLWAKRPLALTLVTVASRRAREEQPHSEVVAFYDKLLPIISHEIFKKGEWVYLDVWGTGTSTLLERSPQHAHLASSAHSPHLPQNSRTADQSWRLMAWRWSYGKERRLCVLNFSDYEGTGRVIVSDAEGEGDIPIVELLSGTRLLHSLDWMCHQRLWCELHRREVRAISQGDAPGWPLRHRAPVVWSDLLVLSSTGAANEAQTRRQSGEGGRGNSITYAELSKEIATQHRASAEASRTQPRDR